MAIRGVVCHPNLKNVPILFLFTAIISYFIPIFAVPYFLFSYFLSSSCDLTAWMLDTKIVV